MDCCPFLLDKISWTPWRFEARVLQPSDGGSFFEARAGPSLVHSSPHGSFRVCSVQGRVWLGLGFLGLVGFGVRRGLGEGWLGFGGWLGLASRAGGPNARKGQQTSHPKPTEAKGSQIESLKKNKQKSLSPKEKQVPSQKLKADLLSMNSYFRCISLKLPIQPPVFT